MAKVTGAKYVGDYYCIDLELWGSLSPKSIRQVRSRVLSYARIKCPQCNELLCVPLDFFTIKKNNRIVSDSPITCATSSKMHGYAGGCDFSWPISIARPNRGAR